MIGVLIVLFSLALALMLSRTNRGAYAPKGDGKVPDHVPNLVSGVYSKTATHALLQSLRTKQSVNNPHHQMKFKNTLPETENVGKNTPVVEVLPAYMRAPVGGSIVNGEFVSCMHSVRVVLANEIPRALEFGAVWCTLAEFADGFDKESVAPDGQPNEQLVAEMEALTAKYCALVEAVSATAEQLVAALGNLVAKQPL